MTTDAYGEAFFPELPAGSYKYKASAANHQDASGRFSVKPGLIVNQLCAATCVALTASTIASKPTVAMRKSRGRCRRAAQLQASGASASARTDLAGQSSMKFFRVLIDGRND